MPATKAAVRDQIETHLFGHFLRTGERFDADEIQSAYERKFNPYHDQMGRFSTAPGVSIGGAQNNTRLAERQRNRQTPARPTPTLSVPPGGQIVVEAGIRAARIAKDAAAQARSHALAAKPQVRALLNQIALGEGVGDEVANRHGFASSYDVPFNYGRFAQQSKPLTQMTLKEIDELQTRVLANPDNSHIASPMGKYQLVRTTLRQLRAELDLNDNMIFDAALQDRLGTKLLERRGLQDYIDGKIAESTFRRRIADEWASIADPQTGKPRRPRQHLGTTTSQISPLIRALRENENR